jgi:hypothetical protein
MNEVLTMEEIESRYDSEWVLIEDPVLNENLEVLQGKVIYHSRDRDEFDRESLRYPTRHAAVLYVGEPPVGMEFVL